MRPKRSDLDEEIRGHLALEIKRRIESGEDPERARLAAMKDFGNVPLTRDSIENVWRPRWYHSLAALGHDVRLAIRSLLRAKGLAFTVVLTLALGIGVNAAIFSVVRGVLLRPLVNRDEDRLVYIRQSTPGREENMTFSIPEIEDFKARVTSVAAFGDFSVTDMSTTGLLSEPRMVKAGVVSGTFFDVMGLRPALGRLVNVGDDGPGAPGVAVLTYRFWATALHRDPGVIGRSIRLGPGTATIIGVLEPAVPYPVETEIIANVVTSPHHLGAAMKTGRWHRMTELFGRLKPGVSLDAARAELASVHAAMVSEHPESYGTRKDVQLSVTRLRDQIAAPARTMLVLLLAAAAIVFVIALSNVANLILARSVRREGELAVRAALGAGRAALRRTLLAESVVLCGAGAAVGVLFAQPFVAAVARYASRFSVRALDVAPDASVLWIGAGLAMAAAVVLAYIPRLPSSHAPVGLGLATGSLRITPGTNRRLRIFATAQIALSFMLLAGAGMLLTTLVSEQRSSTGFDMHVLAFNLPTPALGVTNPLSLYDEARRRIGAIPGVEGAAHGSFVPWRDAGGTSLSREFRVEGYTPVGGETNPRARQRFVSPGFFAVVGLPLVDGRELTDADRTSDEPVALVSQAIAQRFFPNADAVNRRFWWTEDFMGNAATGKPVAVRVVGVVDDVDDENVIGFPAMTVYMPIPSAGLASRMFVRTVGDPYSFLPSITRAVHEVSADQPVDRAATLEDVRADVLSGDRVNAFVFSGFASIALLIAVVGIAGVLSFSVSARVREFGVRLAVGSAPRQIVGRIVSEGVTMAAMGIAAGAAGGYALARIATNVFGAVQLPGAMPIAIAAGVIVVAATVAALIPAARASRVDVVQALR